MSLLEQRRRPANCSFSDTRSCVRIPLIIAEFDAVVVVRCSGGSGCFGALPPSAGVTKALCFSYTSKRLERSASPPRAKFRVARCKARLWFGLRAKQWPALALVRPEVPERCKLRCKLERKVGAKGSERGRIRDNKNQRDGEKQSIL